MSSQITLTELKNHLWEAANILRGDLDASEFRQPIMTMMFLKRLNDQFEETQEKLKQNQKTITDPDRYDFFIPDEARWKKISETFENIGEKIDKICGIIENHNPQLEGVLTNTSYNDKKRFPDDNLLELVTHFNSKFLGNSNLENEDIFGRAYEYLLEQFADSAGKKAGEFFTPREVVQLLVNIVKPTERMMICDPTCGSGGMLIWSRKYLEEKAKNPKNISLHGQERNFGNFGMCKINMILHGVKSFRIEHENVIETPLLVDNGKLIKYDLILANYPFSMKLNKEKAKNDPYHRFDLGVPPKNFADFAFIQHIYSTLNQKGKAAIISSQGALYRLEIEKDIRTVFVDSDHIEGVIALPANLFYGTGIPACVLLFNKNKPENRKNKIIFIYAANDYEKSGKKDILKKEHIRKIVNTFDNFLDIEKYSHVADIDEIKKNDYNLNVPRYVDVSEEEEEIDIKSTMDKLNDTNNKKTNLVKQLNLHLNELGFSLEK